MIIVTSRHDGSQERSDQLLSSRLNAIIREHIKTIVKNFYFGPDNKQKEHWWRSF